VLRLGCRRGCCAACSPGRSASADGRPLAGKTSTPKPWTPAMVQVTAAAGRVLSEVVAVARRDGLVAQSYWLATTLALGAFLKVRTYSRLCKLTPPLDSEASQTRYHPGAGRLPEIACIGIPGTDTS
jgi:hypothetical protein